MRIRVVFTVLVCFAIAGLASPSAAQDASPSYGTAIVTANAPIYLNPDTARVPLRTAAVNTVLRVVEDLGDWLKVEFQDPQFGRRVGYVQASNVRVSRPNQQPMDLSIPGSGTPQPGTVAPPVRTSESAPIGVAPRTKGFSRGWIDVNFGSASAFDVDPTSTFTTLQSSELATYTVQYHWTTGAAFNAGGGFLFVPNFGIGVSFQGTAHVHPADLTIRIPHPLAFNRFASDSAPTEGDLERIDSSVNIQAMFVGDLTDHLRVRVSAGPSLFRTQRDAVSRIGYDQVYLGTLNSVNITTYDTQKVEYADGMGWGYNVGGDISWFFTRVIGVGGFASLTRGTVTAFDPFTRDDADFKVGGAQFGGGLRLRF